MGMAEEKQDGSRHPLPASDEARRDLIPEHLVEEKGLGDDPAERTTPPGQAVNPGGERYESGGDEGNC